MTDEGTLDPYVAEWLHANPGVATPLAELPPELLRLARSPGFGAPPSRDIAKVTDDVVAGISVRCYEHEAPPTGLVVYFHGGGFCLGSVGLMDNVARELAFATGAAVVSVEYRLAPEHPFPAGLDDCEAVTRWALANAERFGATAAKVAVAGESAGGNLSAALALRLRDNNVQPHLAAQVLIYPVLDGRNRYPSRDAFDGIVIDTKSGLFDDAYRGGHNRDADPYFSPLQATSLAGLPPALVVIGGCDPLRDEGRLYGQRLAQDGVRSEELCCPGQPHGFINFDLPAAADAFARIGAFLREVFAAQAS